MNKTLLCAVVVLLGFLTGCVTPRNITYMQGFDQGMAQSVRALTRLKIQPDDKLSIVVSASDPELAQVFNLFLAQVRVGTTAKNSLANNGQVSAYTVYPDGTITFPILGNIHVAGMERRELAAMIEERIVAQNLLKDPVVTVEFLNATISVLGDVASPGEYVIDKDYMTILQAISKAGDLTITGKRDNVLVVREENGKDVAYRIDLTNTAQMMESPAYYLQQNDVVYVEPNNTKKRQSTVNGNSVLTPSFWISIMSFVSTLVVLFVK